MEWKQVELADRKWVDPLLRESGFRGSEYCFANLFNWRGIAHIRISRFHGFCMIRWETPQRRSYLFPAGRGDLTMAIEALQEDAAEHGKPFLMISLDEGMKERLERIFPGKFEFTPVRDSFDYLYETQKLITLAGKKLHAKRNHINSFMECYSDWRFELITPENIEECWQMSLEWCNRQNCKADVGMQREFCSVKSAFDHYFELKLQGGLLRAGGKVVAITLGEPITEDTFITHVEKAYSEIRGAYPLINQQFAEHVCAPYRFVNREDDAGVEGLRRAKMSYQPILLEKYAAVLKR